MFGAQNKFKAGDQVRVNRRAKKRSWFLYKKGKIVDYWKKCYGIEFTLPGNGNVEYRRIQAYHLTKAR